MAYIKNAFWAGFPSAAGQKAGPEIEDFLVVLEFAPEFSSPSKAKLGTPIVTASLSTAYPTPR